MSKIQNLIPTPNINVTSLIDVLLVLLIIFMVAVPMRAHRFLTKYRPFQAPRGLKYGEVVKVMDGLKATGAGPIGLQLDALQ